MSTYYRKYNLLEDYIVIMYISKVTLNSTGCIKDCAWEANQARLKELSAELERRNTSPERGAVAH